MQTLICFYSAFTLIINKINFSTCVFRAFGADFSLPAPTNNHLSPLHKGGKLVYYQPFGLPF